MVADTVSLGVLTLGYAASQLGLIFAIILLVAMAIFTTLTGLLYHRFWMRHRYIKSLPDALKVAFGGSVIARWVAEIMSQVFLNFVMTGHVILFRSAMVAFFGKKPCAIIWTAIGSIIMLAFTLLRAFKLQTPLCMICTSSNTSECIVNSKLIRCVACMSIILAIVLILVDLGLHPPAELQESPWKWITLFGTESTENTISSFATVCAATSNILVSFTGHFAYFTILPVSVNFPPAFESGLYGPCGFHGLVCFRLTPYRR